MSDVIIRRFVSTDHADWAALWQGYNDFYRRTVEARTTKRLWGLLLSGAGEPFAYAAELDGKVVGLAHYYFTPSTSDWTPRCFLQDLFASTEARGHGVGRALIEALYADADRHDAAQVFWLTEDSNATARQLYDRVARKTAFIKYQR